MMNRSPLVGTLGALSLATAALVFPAVGHAEDDCAYNYYLNTETNQCQYCDNAIAYWNAETNQCLPGVNPVLGPAGPVGVGPDPVVGPAGPVGVGPNPVVGPAGPAGVGPNPIIGPAGPGGLGPR